MDRIIDIVMAVSALVISVSFHEAAHAYAAWRMGDPTAKLMGRITLNPIKHLDPVGSVALPVILSLMGLPAFGWAKPVRVNPANFRELRKGDIIVSLAGVMANLGLAIVTGLFLRLLFLSVDGRQTFSALQLIWRMLPFFITFIYLNLILFVFNLIPVPPLDGGRVVSALFPHSYQAVARHFQAASLALLIILMVTGSLDSFISAVVRPLFIVITGPDVLNAFIQMRYGMG
ncbi:MAG: site-2 protease family protein [Deltaproteobacteria bacterium]|nr:site-2 protease family protein [Deltaproteobacteria bacterium]